MQSKKKSRISLVGAGPGDVDLITRKGLCALQTADVVLYDALVNPELLLDAPVEAKKIYVGKRANNHRYSQEEINLMMVEMALAHGHVVRLKGGDPFVFGRGHEELEFAQAFQIETQVIPGISSCIAVPAAQSVPLTKRGYNQSFWVLTGTTRTGQLSEDVTLAAQSTATVVILMGMRKLGAIVEVFKAAGKTDCPAMVVQRGTWAGQRQVVATVDDIEAAVAEAKLGAPAIILIGEVVRLHPEWKAISALIQQRA